MFCIVILYRNMRIMTDRGCAMLKKNVIGLFVTTCVSMVVLPTVASTSPGPIILIHGISSGGKTSLTQELASQIGTSKTQIMSTGKHMRAKIDEKALELGYDLEGKKQLWWQDFYTITERFTDQERQDFGLQLWQSFFATIKDAALQGNIVLVDTVDVPCMPIFLESMRDMQLTLVLLYTPLSSIVKFLERRNDCAAVGYNKYNKRSLLISLIQYQKLFKPAAHESDPVVDRLDINSATHYLDCMNQEVDKLTSKPENFEEEFIRYFKLDQMSSVNTTPIFSYDLIVYGSELSISERAQLCKNLLRM